MRSPTVSGRIFIARHGETVFNASARVQGDTLHTPLTRSGFAQADAIGQALRAHLGPDPRLGLWASDTGRALQTLAIIAEHLVLDWHDARVDGRLGEIGMGSWGGRYYRDIIAETGALLDSKSLLFTRRAPGGEWFDGIAERLRAWLAQYGATSGDVLVITHGVTSRVLRGLLTGAEIRPDCGVPVADRLPQGSLVLIEGGRETVIHEGRGAAPA